MSVRFFAGLMNSNPRVRISRPGKDASDANVKGKDLQFDSNWETGLTIHALGRVSASSTAFNFSNLSYIPFCYVQRIHKLASGSSYGVGFYQMIGDYSGDVRPCTISRGSVTLPGGRADEAIVAVFRAKAFDSGQGAGYVGGSAPRLLIGQGGSNVGNQYGLFISRPKYDVTKCASGDLIFTSLADIANITGFFYKTFTKADFGGGPEVFLTDALIGPDPGYTPFFMAAMSRPGSSRFYWPQDRSLDGNNIVGAPVKAHVILGRKKGKLYYSLDVQSLNSNGPGDSVSVLVAVFDVKIP